MMQHSSNTRARWPRRPTRPKTSIPLSPRHVRSAKQHKPAPPPPPITFEQLKAALDRKASNKDASAGAAGSGAAGEAPMPGATTAEAAGQQPAVEAACDEASHEGSEARGAPAEQLACGPGEAAEAGARQQEGGTQAGDAAADEEAVEELELEDALDDGFDDELLIVDDPVGVAADPGAGRGAGRVSGTGGTWGVGGRFGCGALLQCAFALRNCYCVPCQLARRPACQTVSCSSCWAAFMCLPCCNAPIPLQVDALLGSTQELVDGLNAAQPEAQLGTPAGQHDDDGLELDLGEDEDDEGDESDQEEEEEEAAGSGSGSGSGSEQASDEEEQEEESSAEGGAACQRAQTTLSAQLHAPIMLIAML